jgi:imidazole glycerol-phosphate synthase subunit HisH
VKVALIDYGAGNIHSAQKALEHAAQAGDIPATITVTDRPDVVRQADRIVMPGDGAFADCMGHLAGVPGLADALEETVRRKGRPFLGICVGMQLLADEGLEYGATPGLGWIPGKVKRMEPDDSRLKIPHMGWNTLARTADHALLRDIPLGPDGLHAYFLHAYHLSASNPSDIVAEAHYGGAVTAIVARNSVAGVQFHPEKSQRLGLALLANFLRWTP